MLIKNPNLHRHSTTRENMLVKNPNHDRPLYYMGYIRSTNLERVLIDPDSTLSITPVCLMQFLCITVCKLAVMTTTIHGLNAQHNRPVRKIFLKCHFGNLEMEFVGGKICPPLIKINRKKVTCHYAELAKV